MGLPDTAALPAHVLSHEPVGASEPSLFPEAFGSSFLPRLSDHGAQRDARPPQPPRGAEPALHQRGGDEAERTSQGVRGSRLWVRERGRPWRLMAGFILSHHQVARFPTICCICLTIEIDFNILPRRDCLSDLRNVRGLSRQPGMAAGALAESGVFN